MKLVKLIFCTIMLMALCVGCDDDSNPTGPIPPLALSVEMISYRCYDDYHHPPLDATVEIIDSTDYSFFVPVKDSGWFWTRVYPRRYTIVVETDNTWPDTFENIDVHADTTLTLLIGDDFFYTDKLDFCFYYRGDTLGESWEREIIGEVDRLTDNIFIPDEAIRELIQYEWGPVQTNYTVPVCEEYRVWYAYNAVRKIINEHQMELPPDFYIDPGSFICFD